MTQPDAPSPDQATGPRRMSTMELALNACRLVLSLVLDRTDEALVLWTNESGSDDVLRALAVALIAQNDRLTQRGEPRYRLPVDVHWRPGQTQPWTRDPDLADTGERDVIVLHVNAPDVTNDQGRVVNEALNRAVADVRPPTDAQVVIMIEQTSAPDPRAPATPSATPSDTSNEEEP